MSWNHKSTIVALALAIQPVAGVFTAPAAADIILVSGVTNSSESIDIEDPTLTGTLWKAPPQSLGRTSMVGFTQPLRGPGGAAPFAANGWVPGRALQACGWSEIIQAASATRTTVGVSTATAMNLNTAESAVDGMLVGAPIQQALIAAGSGIAATSLVRSYTGVGRVAEICETMTGAPASGASYTIPAHVRYQLGTLNAAPPLLSISVWRDKKRYDYRDWRPSSWNIDLPVANEFNTSLPSLEVSGKGIQVSVVDDTTPSLPDAMLALAIPPARGGKFFLDRVKLGHQQFKFGINYDVGAASNQNAAAGQDSYDILSGDRTIELDLNQSNQTDINLESRIDGRTIMPIMSTWGLGAGMNFGFVVPNTFLKPLNPGERNGYVSLTGQAHTIDVDKSAAFTIWW